MWGSVSQTMIQDHPYPIRCNNIFYLSRRVPTDVCSRFHKDRVIVSLHTRSLPKAEWSADALSDRLERYWHSIRLEIFHTRELGLSVVREAEASNSLVSVSIKDALTTYIRLKGVGRNKTFFQGAERAVGYLTEATGAVNAFKGNLVTSDEDRRNASTVIGNITTWVRQVTGSSDSLC